MAWAISSQQDYLSHRCHGGEPLGPNSRHVFAPPCSPSTLSNATWYALEASSVQPSRTKTAMASNSSSGCRGPLRIDSIGVSPESQIPSGQARLPGHRWGPRHEEISGQHRTSRRHCLGGASNPTRPLENCLCMLSRRIFPSRSCEPMRTRRMSPRPPPEAGHHLADELGLYLGSFSPTAPGGTPLVSSRPVSRSSDSVRVPEILVGSS